MPIMIMVVLDLFPPFLDGPRSYNFLRFKNFLLYYVILVETVWKSLGRGRTILETYFYKNGKYNLSV